MRSRTFAAVCGLAVTGFVYLDRFVLLPAHPESAFQGSLAYLNGLAHLLAVPLMTLGAPDWRGGPAPLLLLLFPLYAAVGFVWHAIWKRRDDPAVKSPSPAPTETPGLTPPAPINETPPTLPTRRSLLRGSVLTTARVASAGAVGLAGYGMCAETRRFEINRHTVTLAGLPKELDGLRVVQLTDLHHGPWIPIGYVRQVVDATNALEPDLVLLTGDYVSRSPRYIVPAAQALANLRPSIGTVGVLGNHDWWEGADRTREQLARAKVRLIDNARVVLTPGRSIQTESSQGLCLAGVGDFWEDKQDYAAALDGVPDAMPRLLLSHNPDVAEVKEFTGGGRRVDLMLSGHTHGGQVRVPGLGTPVVPSFHGQKYAAGFVDGPACRVFVSKGLGMAVLPVRFMVRPEIVLFELRSA